jgi:hypothetical protein
VIDARFRPLAAPPYKNRKRSTFKASWNDTLDKLEKELTNLGARDVNIQAGFQIHEIRNDGWPRGGRRPSHPAVVLSFLDRKGTPLSFPCDTYDDHEDNIRAIALSLEALRAVNRYGVTKGHEQYQGFAQLPAADPSQQRTEAIAYFSRITGWTEQQIRGDLQGAYRLAAKATHPDSGGSNEAFNAMRSHWTVLQS